MICGTGPSISTVPWDALPPDATMLSVNGAVLAMPRCDVLAFCDPPTVLLSDYGKQIMVPMGDPTIRRITRGSREPIDMPHWVGPIEFVNQNDGPGRDKEARISDRTPLDRKFPLFWGDGLTNTFAVLWAVAEGFVDLIFVGHDMKPGKGCQHFSAYRNSPNANHRLSCALERHFRVMQGLWPESIERGIKLRAVGPSRLLEIMPAWEPSHDANANAVRPALRSGPHC